MSEEERELFHKMLSHHNKSFATNTTEEVRGHHKAIYEEAKKELWRLQDERRRSDA